MKHYIALLQRRPHFRLLWLAQVISLTGDWFNTIATVILVNRYLHDSDLALSFLFLARSLPVFLLSPVAGVIADRFNRKTMLMVSNLLRVFIVLGFLLVNNADAAWLIYVLTIMQFSVSAFFEPAYAAIVPSLVERDELLTANTLGGVTWSAMLTLGALVGGVVASIAGVQVALITDAATFAIAAALVLLIQLPPEANETPLEANHFMDFIDGFKYIRKNPDVGLITLVKGMVQVPGSVDVLASVYAARVFVVGNDGATALGIFFAAHGVGAMLGPLLGDRFGDGGEAHLKHWISIGFWLVVLGWATVGVGPSLAVVTFGMVLRGMGGAINWTYSSVLLQKKVPDNYLGRVFGLDFTLFTLALSIAVLVPGLAMDGLNISPRTMVVCTALASLVPTLLWISAIRLQRNVRARHAAAD